jgi:hypothetical protein
MRQRYWPSVEVVGNYAIFSRFNNLDTFFNRFQRHNINVGVEARAAVRRGYEPSVAVARTELVEPTLRSDSGRIRSSSTRRALQAARQAGADLTAEELQLAVAQENARVATVQWMKDARTVSSFSGRSSKKVARGTNLSGRLRAAARTTTAAADHWRVEPLVS